jgi:hypothetical protein
MLLNKFILFVTITGFRYGKKLMVGIYLNMLPVKISIQISQVKRPTFIIVNGCHQCVKDPQLEQED